MRLISGYPFMEDEAGRDLVVLNANIEK